MEPDPIVQESLEKLDVPGSAVSATHDMDPMHDAAAGVTKDGPVSIRNKCTRAQFKCVDQEKKLIEVIHIMNGIDGAYHLLDLQEEFPQWIGKLRLVSKYVAARLENHHALFRWKGHGLTTCCFQDVATLPNKQLSNFWIGDFYGKRSLGEKVKLVAESTRFEMATIMGDQYMTNSYPWPMRVEIAPEQLFSALTMAVCSDLRYLCMNGVGFLQSPLLVTILRAMPNLRKLQISKCFLLHPVLLLTNTPMLHVLSKDYLWLDRGETPIDNPGTLDFSYSPDIWEPLRWNSNGINSERCDPVAVALGSLVQATHVLIPIKQSRMLRDGKFRQALLDKLAEVIAAKRYRPLCENEVYSLHEGFDAYLARYGLNHSLQTRLEQYLSEDEFDTQRAIREFMYLVESHELPITDPTKEQILDHYLELATNSSSQLRNIDGPNPSISRRNKYLAMEIVMRPFLEVIVQLINGSPPGRCVDELEVLDVARCTDIALCQRNSAHGFQPGICYTDQSWLERRGYSAMQCELCSLADGFTRHLVTFTDANLLEHLTDVHYEVVDPEDLTRSLAEEALAPMREENDMDGWFHLANRRFLGFDYSMHLATFTAPLRVSWALSEQLGFTRPFWRFNPSKWF